MIKEEVFRVITSVEQEKKNGVSMWLTRLQFFPFSIQLRLKFFKQVLKKILARLTSTHWFSP